MDDQASATAARATEATASEASAHEAKPSTAQEEVVKDVLKMEEAVAAVKEAAKAKMNAKEPESWEEGLWTSFVKDVVLFLLVKGKFLRHIVAAAVGLIVYGVAVEEDLQNVGQGEYAAFRDTLADKYGIPAAICDLLFAEYVSKKRPCEGSEDEGSSAAKRMCVNSVPLVEMDEFLHNMHRGKTGEEGSLIEFGRNMLGMEKYPLALFVRKCYTQLYEDAMRLMCGGRPGERIVAVFGTPGVGKTVFGLYALYQLTKRGATVMYYHGGADALYLFGSSESKVLHAARVHGFRVPEPEAGSFYVGRVRGRLPFDRQDTLVHFLEGQEELFYIYDPPVAGISIREDVRCKVLVVSSPHRGRQNEMKNNQTMLFMPPWAFAELEEANERLGAGLSAKDLEDRWTQFGGVARWVLAASPGPGEQKLEKARRSLNEARIFNVLNPFGDHPGAAVDSKDISGLVVHIWPSEDFRSYTTRISTPGMLSEICTKLHLRSNSEVLEWAKSAQRVCVDLNVGSIIEVCWHNQLMLSGPVEGCEIRELTEPEVSEDGLAPQVESAAKSVKASAIGTRAAKRGKAAAKGGAAAGALARRMTAMGKAAKAASTAVVTVPRFTKVVPFASPVMADLPNLEIGDYAKPDNVNFRTVDSLVLLKNPFCDPTNSNTCVVCFQMTVGRNHPLNIAGGLEIRRKFGEMLKQKPLDLANMFIVFVVPAALAKEYKKQNWLSEKKIVSATTPLKEIRQFVLVLPDTALGAADAMGD